jgi:hypothetical protein
MLFDGPVSLTEAVRVMLAKKILPTALDSAGIRSLDAGLRRQSVLSAKTTNAFVLGKYKDVIESILNPKSESESESGRARTVGYNPATGREKIRNFLRSMGYAPTEGEEGSITDLSSDARINLVIDTNVKMAQGAGAFIRQNDAGVVDEWPALELVRFEDREKPRNWGETTFGSRWMLAAQSCGDIDAAKVFEKTGRMVALKSSAIWQALGDGAGGFDDTLGNPFPPFAFNSGMNTLEVSRKEAVEFGLIEPGEQAGPAPLDLTELFSE